MTNKLFTPEDLDVFHQEATDTALRGSMLFLGLLSVLPRADLREIFTPDIIDRIRSWEK